MDDGAGSLTEYLRLDGGSENIVASKTIIGNLTGNVTGLSSLNLPLAGGIMSGNIGRSAHNSGFLVGGYNNIGASQAKTSPIYAIGTSYLPNDSALSNMYGIGYTRGDASFLSGTGGWGFYVAAAGSATIFLDGENGGVGTASNSWRAPIFYDSNNTTYRIDGASTSQLNVLNVAGTLTVTGAGGCVATKFVDYGNGSYYLDPASTSTSLNVAGSGVFASDVIAFSDKKLKTNIKTLDGTKVLKMRGVSFDRIDNNKKGSGVIAQELQEIAPELIPDNNGTLGVSYGNITGYLIEAIKNQQKQIDDLKTQIQTLKNN